MKKTAIIAIAVLLMVPATVSASRFSASKIGEQIVEGHTVFTVLQKRVQEQGFDIVIKVREIRRGPNVLWFNDQWKTFFEEVRQPCAGYVLATYTGVDPTSLLSQAVIGVNGVTQPLGLGITYIESYHITDPNGAVWDTDLYAVTGVYGRTIPIWISSVHNAQAPDDGIAHCDGIQDLASHGNPTTQAVTGLTYCGYYDCDDNVPIREYNADIFGLWADVNGERPGKFHGFNSTTGAPLANDLDGTGCEERSAVDTTEWECRPLGNAALGDDNEGNSHPYNPYFAPNTTKGHAHETSRLDVFFFSNFGPSNSGLLNAAGGYPPSPRTYAVFDSEQVESDVSDCNYLGFYNHSKAAGDCGLGYADL